MLPNNQQKRSHRSKVSSKQQNTNWGSKQTAVTTRRSNRNRLRRDTVVTKKIDSKKGKKWWLIIIMIHFSAGQKNMKIRKLQSKATSDPAWGLTGIATCVTKSNAEYFCPPPSGVINPVIEKEHCHPLRPQRWLNSAQGLVTQRPLMLLAAPWWNV